MREPLPISRVHIPTLQDFKTNYLERAKPVVITGLAQTWPATQLWSLDYLSENFGDVKATTIQVKNGQAYADKENGVVMRQTPVKESVKPIAAGELQDTWAITSPVEFFPSAFKNDYHTPVYCANGKYLHSRIWVSPKGAVTPLHQDLPENLYVLVKGGKRITLYSPMSPVYVNSRFSKIPNLARVDPEGPDFTKYPKFREAQAYTVELQAGEALFIPSFWWHHLRNVESSIALNFWWARGWKVSLSWAAAQYKKMRTVGNRD